MDLTGQKASSFSSAPVQSTNKILSGAPLEVTPPPGSPEADRPSAPPASQTLLASQNLSALTSAFSSRLDALVSKLGDIRSERSANANKQENLAASESASSGRLAALAEAASQSDLFSTDLVTQDTTLEEMTTRLEARIDQIREKQVDLATNFAPPELPDHGDQKSELRGNLQSISSGLQADAATEAKRTVQATARNTEVAARNEQRQTIRSNQAEVVSLQRTRRQMDQEAQATDQAIRQLQSETNRLKNGGTTTGTTLDILAQ